MENLSGFGVKMNWLIMLVILNMLLETRPGILRCKKTIHAVQRMK